MRDNSKSQAIYLREVTIDDVELLFKWVNDLGTRSNSFDPHMISWEEHKNWFEGMIRDPKQISYIMMHKDTPVGQIRFNLSENIAEISYSIAPQERGKGYGKLIIHLAVMKIKSDYPEITKIRALVKPRNEASILCFERNGFSEKYREYEFDTDSVDIISRGGGKLLKLSCSCYYSLEVAA